MKIRLLLLLLLLPLLGMRKCEKEQPEPALVLPPATQTGANTLGFLVDGRVWITYGATCYFGAGGCAANTLLADYSSSRRGFDMHTKLDTPHRNEGFDLRLDSLVRTGNYPTTTSAVPAFAHRTIRSFGLTLHVGEGINEARYGSFLQTGKAFITITRFDTVQRIIAGTFEGTLRQSDDSTKRVRITDGRFDVRYR